MRLSTVFIAVPVGIVAIAFAVANRQTVALSLDPLPWTVDVPLFAVLYAGIVAGLLIGIVAEWWRERRLRRAAREARATAASLQRENAALKSGQASSVQAGLPVSARPGP